jgi:hypothetical protein
MQEMNEEKEQLNSVNPDPMEAKQHLITEENYQLLQKLQNEVLKATEVSPTIRKIINEIINEENLNKVKTKFINVWK